MLGYPFNGDNRDRTRAEEVGVAAEVALHREEEACREVVVHAYHRHKGSHQRHNSVVAVVVAAVRNLALEEEAGAVDSCWCIHQSDCCCTWHYCCYCCMRVRFPVVAKTVVVVVVAAAAAALVLGP